MKGPLAATMAAAAAVDSGDLEKPVLVMATADEEVGGGGAKQVVRESRFFREAGPSYAVVAEPTQLWPVYAHKGGVLVMATARGRAAHTSTDLGTSANFLIAPFLAEMAELAKDVKGDPRYRNPDFDPPYQRVQHGLRRRRHPPQRERGQVHLPDRLPAHAR